MVPGTYLVLRALAGEVAKPLSPLYLKSCGSQGKSPVTGGEA